MRLCCQASFRGFCSPHSRCCMYCCTPVAVSRMFVMPCVDCAGHTTRSSWQSGEISSKAHPAVWGAQAADSFKPRSPIQRRCWADSHNLSERCRAHEEPSSHRGAPICNVEHNILCHVQARKAPRIRARCCAAGASAGSSQAATAVGTKPCPHVSSEGKDAGAVVCSEACS